MLMSFSIERSHTIYVGILKGRVTGKTGTKIGNVVVCRNVAWGYKLEGKGWKKYFIVRECMPTVRLFFTPDNSFTATFKTMWLSPLTEGASRKTCLHLFVNDGRKMSLRLCYTAYTNIDIILYVSKSVSCVYFVLLSLILIMWTKHK